MHRITFTKYAEYFILLGPSPFFGGKVAAGTNRNNLKTTSKYSYAAFIEYAFNIEQVRDDECPHRARTISLQTRCADEMATEISVCTLCGINLNKKN